MRRHNPIRGINLSQSWFVNNTNGILAVLTVLFFRSYSINFVWQFRQSQSMIISVPFIYGRTILYYWCSSTWTQQAIIRYRCKSPSVLEHQLWYLQLLWTLSTKINSNVTRELPTRKQTTRWQALSCLTSEWSVESNHSISDAHEPNVVERTMDRLA